MKVDGKSQSDIDKTMGSIRRMLAGGHGQFRMYDVISAAQPIENRTDDVLSISSVQTLYLVAVLNTMMHAAIDYFVKLWNRGVDVGVGVCTSILVAIIGLFSLAGEALA